MKEFIGYLMIIIIGLLSILSLMERSETIDNNLSKGSNVVEIFAKK